MIIIKPLKIKSIMKSRRKFIIKKFIRESKILK